MNRTAQWIAFVATMLFLSGSAFAGYKVHVKNQAGQTIKVLYAKYKISTWEYCLPMKNKKINNNKSKGCVIRNVWNTERHKWKIKYKCGGKNYTKSSKSWKVKPGPSHGVTRFTITGCSKVTVQTKIYN